MTALPNLVNRILQTQSFSFSVFADTPKNAHSRHNILKKDGLERLIRFCIADKADAILVLFDSDDDCPKTLAHDFYKRVQGMNIHIPIALVCAKCEYEAWFLANLDALIQNGLLKSDTTYDTTKIEEKRDVKGWLSANMPSGKYKEVTDQLKMTRYIEFERTLELSRSFRRLMHAIQELIGAIDGQKIIITPSF